PNGPCGAMHDANQMNIFAAAALALTLVETDAVDVVTEGHAFEVFDRPAAAERLATLLDQASALDGAAQLLLTDRIDDLPAFVSRLHHAIPGARRIGCESEPHVQHHDDDRQVARARPRGEKHRLATDMDPTRARRLHARTMMVTAP
ncbi:MAG: hypothetical protein ACREXP_31995, partial [Steroidobacteraceae bacterium]